MDTAKIEAGVRLILEGVGEDPEREGLRETPARVARMYEEVLGGLEEDPSRHFDVTFDEGHEEIVLVGDIPFFSMCEHHLAPFFGKAHVAYIPGEDGRICGISKLARLVDGFAKRPQVQERLTGQIADTLVEALPLQPLCREDCRGLCSQCGVDLNEHPDHHHDVTDLRFAALAGLKAQLEAEEHGDK